MKRIEVNTIKISICFYLMILPCSYLSAQLKRPLLKIQQIVLKDYVLVQQIEKLIQEEIKDETDQADTLYQFFSRGLGYINLSIVRPNERGVFRKYYISPGLVSFRKNDPDSKYPLFYSYVANRIVLIKLPFLEDQAAYVLSNESKRRFRNKLKPFLEKTKKIKAYDKEGNLVINDKHFRVDYFKFHSGRYIYIYEDKPPMVLTEREEQARQYKMQHQK